MLFLVTKTRFKHDRGSAFLSKHKDQGEGSFLTFCRSCPQIVNHGCPVFYMTCVLAFMRSSPLPPDNGKMSATYDVIVQKLFINEIKDSQICL